MLLPKPLRPWIAELDLFPDDIARCLGEMVKKLSVFLGQMDRAVLFGLTEPDGYSGLQSKPAYERLLLSEWLLADELPEEFERRAVMGEHLFLKRHTQHSVNSRISIALFDCGPDYIGTPRLVQLALIILLHRKALSMKSQLLWGILQNPGVLYNDVTPHNLTTFLKAHSALRVNEFHIDQWKEYLSTQTQVNGLWINSETIPDKFCDEARIAPYLIGIEDELIPEERSLKLSVTYGKTKRNTSLQIPDDAMCTRILRNPFSTSNSRTKSELRLADSMIFCSGGKKLAARTNKDYAAVFPLPNSAKANPGLRRLFKPSENHKIIAIQAQKRRIVAISSYEQEIFCHNFPGSYQALPVTMKDECEIYIDHDQIGYRNLFLSFASGYTHCAFFLDDALQLFQLNYSSDYINAFRIDEPVCAIKLGRNGLCYMKVETDSKLLLIENVNSYSPLKSAINTDLKITGNVLLGFNHHPNEKNSIIAYEDQEGGWNTIYGTQTQHIEIVSSSTVLGAMLLPPILHGEGGLNFGEQVVLVIHEPESGRIILADCSGEFEITQNPGITHVEFDSLGGNIAYLTSDGTVTVYSSIRNETVVTLESNNV